MQTSHSYCIVDANANHQSMHTASASSTPHPIHATNHSEREQTNKKKITFAAPNGQSDNDILFYYLEMSIISISAHTASPLFCSRVSSSIGKFVNFHALVFDCECEEQSEGIQMR